MIKHSKRARMGLLAVGGSLIGALLASVTVALPAGATLTNPANNTLIGSGSSTTYSMMQQMDVLFNSAPACQQFVPFPSSETPQELDYSCAAPPTTSANEENPFGDISVQEPALGSSNGIAGLEDQGAHGATATSGGVSINVANNVDYARSSRALSSSDLEGLNFVGYAADGVSWFAYTEVNSKATPASSISGLNLTTAQLQAIWNGTDKTWNEVGSSSHAPIVVFSAQEGSGTQSTWKGFLGYDPSAAANQVNCYTPKGGSNTCVGPAVIFENEDAQITPAAFVSSQAGFVNNNPIWSSKTDTATRNQIKSDAIFFFSVGKYNLSCSRPSTGTNCGGSPLGPDATNAVGDINSVKPTEATILDLQWPVPRYLYNVYSNGFNSNVPAATGATLNYVSEVGFICNPNKGSSSLSVDPLTGKTYLSEIQSVITGAGFYPLSADAASGGVNTTPFDEGTLPHSATALLHAGSGGKGTSTEGYSDYLPFDSAATTGPNNDPVGYCVTFDTDSNANT
jgi:ABC-type phosphate transport system substrate-binding protein